MAKSTWEDLELYIEIIRRKHFGEKEKDIARDLDLTLANLKNKITKGKAEFGKVDTSTWELEDISRYPESKARAKTKHNSENEKEISYFGDERIKSLEDLIRVTKTDMKIWVDVKWEPGYWEQAQKMKEVFVDENGNESQHTYPVVVSLYRCRATFVRREPVEIFPVLKPLEINITQIKKNKVKLINGLNRVLTYGDIQYGFLKDIRTNKLTPMHNRLGLDILLQIAQEYIFSHVIDLGDIFDFSEWSDHFLKEPEFYFTTQPAIVEAGWWTTQIREAQLEAIFKLLEGNHDVRPGRLLKKNLLAAYGISPHDETHLPPSLSIPKLLSLHKLGIDYIDGYPDEGYWINNTWFTHGTKAMAGSGSTVAAISKTAVHSTVHGHIHRAEQAYKTIYLRDNTTAVVATISYGALCKTDGTVPGKKKPNWFSGFGVTTISPDPNVPPMAEQIPIIDGIGYYRGKKYIGKDRTKQIEKDTGWKLT